MLLVDDAEQFDDTDQAIAGLLAARPTDLLVVAAGRSDDLRALYSHWTKTVRKSRCGVLLQPNVDFDGDLLGAALPAPGPGRGDRRPRLPVRGGQPGVPAGGEPHPGV